MSLVHTARPLAPLASRLAPAVERLRGSRLALVSGLALSALVAAPTPLPQISLAGPVLATLAAGRAGGRAAAAIGFLAVLAFRQPSPALALAAAAVAVAVGWAVPLLVAANEGADNASAVCIDGDGFASLDAAYGPGAAAHAFDLLRRALDTETRETDLVVHAEGREIVLLLDGSDPAVARKIMARVERRFATWLSDAGYECDLSLGLAQGLADDDLLRSARRSQDRACLE